VWCTARRLASAPARLAASVAVHDSPLPSSAPQLPCGSPVGRLPSAPARLTPSKAALDSFACRPDGSRLPAPLRRGLRLCAAYVPAGFPLRSGAAHGFRLVHGPSTCFRSSAARGFRLVQGSDGFPPLRRGSRPRMVHDFPLRFGATCASVRPTFRRASHSAPVRPRLPCGSRSVDLLPLQRGSRLPCGSRVRSASLRSSAARAGHRGLATPLRRGRGFRAVHGPSTCFRSSAARGFRLVQGSGRLASAPARLASQCGLRTGGLPAPLRRGHGFHCGSRLRSASFRSSVSSAAHGFRVVHGPVGFPPLRRGSRLRMVHGSGAHPTPLRRGNGLRTVHGFLPLQRFQRGSRLPVRFTTSHSAPARHGFRAVHGSGRLPSAPARIAPPCGSRPPALVRLRPRYDSRFCAGVPRLYVAIPNPKKSRRGLGVLRVLAATKPPPRALTYSGLAKTFLSPSPSGPSSRFWMGLRPGMTIATRQCPSSLTHLVS
jgi:hypothetical protein